MPAAMVAVLGTPAVTVAGTAKKAEEEGADDDDDEVSADVDVVAAAAATEEPASSANPRDRSEAMTKVHTNKFIV